MSPTRAAVTKTPTKASAKVAAGKPSGSKSSMHVGKAEKTAAKPQKKAGKVAAKTTKRH